MSLSAASRTANSLTSRVKCPHYHKILHSQCPFAARHPQYFASQMTRFYSTEDEMMPLKGRRGREKGSLHPMFEKRSIPQQRDAVPRAPMKSRNQEEPDLNRRQSRSSGSSFYLKGDMTQQDANSEFPRISVYLARLGLASRREAGEWVKDGKVMVRGKTLTDLSYRVKNTDTLSVKGIGDISPRLAQDTLRPRLWVARKPREVICSRKDEQGRLTLLEVLQKQGFPDHISWVGRLDYMSEGLILLTNDGYLKKYLERPETGMKRVYLVRARGHIQEHQLKSIESGSMVQGVKYGKMEVKIKGAEHGDGNYADKTSTWLEMTLTEGKNREIRKVLEHLGLQVTRLIRVKYGPFELPRRMSVGQVKEVPIPAELLQRTNFNYIDMTPEQL